ncbi:MAG: hypothetical protein EBX52_14505 [Proteobacteria bacterium]|nr:hypothetical protein [Pseudomonadota bacterium]
MNRILFLLAGVAIAASGARASVFTLPQFVEHKSWAVGFEPEVTLETSNPGGGAGVAMNTKFTYGIKPLSNLQIGIGPGSGEKSFRFGGAYTFDFIPDLQGQIGAGLAAQAYYFNLRSGSGKLEAQVFPYLHKMFPGNGVSFDPYLAMPYGVSFVSGSAYGIWQLALGNYFKTSNHLGYNTELGLNLKNSDTYLSLGVTYRD